MTTPTASVVICVYTEERWDAILRCLDGVSKQTLTPLEVFVSVDHNPEMHQRLVREVSPLHPSVNFLDASEGPRGIGTARNTGANAATAEIVAFLDDDAAPEPGWLAALITPFAESDVLVAAGRVIPNWLGTNKAPWWFPPEYLWIVGSTWRGFGKDHSEVRNPVGASMAVRRSVLNELNGFDPSIVYCNDETDLCLRIRKAHPESRVLYAPESIINHEVPAARQNPRYFFKRCWTEGMGKGKTSENHGRGTLMRELDYCIRYLTTGVLGSLVTLRLGRVVFLVGGFGTTLIGWIYSRTKRALAK